MADSPATPKKRLPISPKGKGTGSGSVSHVSTPDVLEYLGPKQSLPKLKTSTINAQSQSPFSKSLKATSKTAQGPQIQINNLELDAIRSKLEEEENTREMCELELRDAKGSIDRLQAEYLALEERLLEKTTEAERHDSELKSLKVRLKEVEYESQQDRLKLIDEHERLNKKQDDMKDTIKRLHLRKGSTSNISPPSHLEQLKLEDDSSSHSRSSSSTNLFSLQMSITTKDRRILSLESQVVDLESQLQAFADHGDARIIQIERRVTDLVEENARLREDIDGYQTLLHDKTVNGEFLQSQFMQSTSSNNKYQSMRGLPNDLDLASEMDNASQDHDIENQSQQIEKAGRAELEEEVLKLQEDNKALHLYVNTMTARMLGTKEFEHLLAKDPADMKPSQRQKSTAEIQTAPSFLQRTKSVLSRRSTVSDPVTSQINGDNLLLPVRETIQTVSNTSSFERRSTPSPHRSLDESKKRTISPGINRSPPSNAKGLRTLASGVAADRISAKEARRLSAQFAPAASPPPFELRDAKQDKAESIQNKRSTWIGWLGGKLEKDEPGRPVSSASVPQSSASDRAFRTVDLTAMKENEPGIDASAVTRVDSVAM